ncbi:MAG TPA: hypothetical protein VEA41_04525 [Salinarimonas sp.]|nr:hypothetical protein [Salinarimonas sp.]
MAHLYFHCTNAHEALRDRAGRDVPSLAEAHREALALARLVMDRVSGLGDFRDWRIHVEDEEGSELMLVPFTFARAELH